MKQIIKKCHQRKSKEKLFLNSFFLVTLIFLISKLNYGQIYEDKIIIKFPIIMDIISFKKHPDFTDIMDVFFINYNVSEVEYEDYVLRGSFKVSLYWDPYSYYNPVKSDTIYFYGLYLKNLAGNLDIIFNYFKENVFDDWIDDCKVKNLIHCYDTKNEMGFTYNYSDNRVGIFKSSKVIEREFPIEEK